MITRSLLLLGGASLLAGCVAYPPGPASPGYTTSSLTYYGYQPAQTTVYTYQQPTPYAYPFYSPEFPYTGETGGNGG